MGLYDEEKDVLGTDSVAGINEGLGDGNATVVLGKVYKNKFKSGKTAVTADLFVTFFNPANGGAGVSMLTLKSDDKRKVTGLDFPKDAKGDYVTFGQPIRVNFMEADESSSPMAINMAKINRRNFAKLFPGALVNDQVVWKEVQKAAGTFISVDLVKNGKYVNADLASMSVYNQTPVSQEILVKLYETLAAEIQKRRDAKNAASEPPPTAAPAPDDGDLPF